MEHAASQRRPEREPAQEARRQQNRAASLDRQRAENDVAHQPHHAAHGVHTERLRQHHPLFEADAAAQNDVKDCGDGHKAKAADLDQQQNDPLAENAPVQAGLHHRKPRHTCCGGRGEQARQKARRRPGRGGYRQRQDGGADQNDRQEHHRNDLRRRHFAQDIGCARGNTLKHGGSILPFLPKFYKMIHI